MSWWQYLLLVNLYLLLFYGFYALLLRKETFFQLNRIYLVASGILSFLIPLIQSNWVKDLFITQQVKTIIYQGQGVIINFKPVQEQPVTLAQILAVVYLGGVMVLFIRLVWRLIQLKRLINEPSVSSSYSFFTKIRLAEASQQKDLIAAHEQVHAHQWHSADVLLIELIAVINWFNPVVYAYRKAAKHIHEFIADRKTLAAGASKSDYALLLLSQTFNAPAHQLVNPFFNNSLLKQRIIMLQKTKSKRVMLVKYCLSAPLFMLMLILSSATVNKNIDIKLITDKAERVLANPVLSIADTGVPAAERKILTESKTARPFVKAGTLSLTLDTIKNPKGIVFSAVEQTPEFPGGINMFMKFLAQNIHYPDQMRKNKIQGRVIATFIVEEDGSLSDIQILRQPGYGSGEEAERVLALSPKWTPGMQNGKPVRVQFTVPVNFAMAESDIKKDTTHKTGFVPSSGTSVNGVVNKNQLGGNDQYANSITVSDGNQPLYVVDGAEAKTGVLKSINPSDIKSITILKDKNATAIYGDKGANGVILITTKKAAALQKNQ